MQSSVCFQKTLLTQDDKKRSAKVNKILMNCLISSKQKKNEENYVQDFFSSLMTPPFFFLVVPCKKIKTSKPFFSIDLQDFFALNHSRLVESMQAAITLCVLLKSILASSGI